MIKEDRGLKPQIGASISPQGEAALRAFFARVLRFSLISYLDPFQRQLPKSISDLPFVLKARRFEPRTGAISQFLREPSNESKPFLIIKPFVEGPSSDPVLTHGQFAMRLEVSRGRQFLSGSVGYAKVIFAFDGRRVTIINSEDEGVSIS